MTELEARSLFLAVLAARHPDSVSETELKNIVDWAVKVEIEYGVFQNILRGNVLVKWGENDEPTFFLSPKGKILAKEIDGDYSKLSGAGV